VGRSPFTNALDQTTTVEAYDPRGRLLTHREAVGSTDLAVTRYSHDAAGNLRFVTAPNGVVTEYRYDAANQLERIIDGSGQQWVVTDRDARGEVLAVQLREADDTLTFQASQSFHDHRQIPLLSASLDGEGNETRYEWDANGNLLSIQDPALHLTTVGHDALNRLTRLTDALSGVTSRSHDALDRLTALTDPGGLTTQYAIDGHGDTRTRTSPDTGVTTATYSAAGRLASRTDALDQTLDLDHDALNRLTALRQRPAPDGSGQLWDIHRLSCHQTECISESGQCG